MFDPVAHPYNTYSLSSSQRMDCYSIIEQMGGLDAYEEVARNQQASIDILERLLFDKDCKVFIAAIENPNTPGKAIEMRAVKFIQELCDPGRSSDFSRFFCLLDIRAPLYLLEKYSGAQSWLSRFAVAKNPSTSLEILKILTQDKHPVVKKTAQEHMRVFEN